MHAMEGASYLEIVVFYYVKLWFFTLPLRGSTGWCVCVSLCVFLCVPLFPSVYLAPTYARMLPVPTEQSALKVTLWQP